MKTLNIDLYHFDDLTIPAQQKVIVKFRSESAKAVVNLSTKEIKDMFGVELAYGGVEDGKINIKAKLSATLKETVTSIRQSKIPYITDEFKGQCMPYYQKVTGVYHERQHGLSEMYESTKTIVIEFFIKLINEKLEVSVLNIDYTKLALSNDRETLYCTWYGSR